MVFDPGVAPEHMEHPFQLELFESWRLNDHELMAFTPRDLDAYVSCWQLNRFRGLDYYGRQNELAGVVMPM